MSTPPTLQDFRDRFPAFAAVPDDRVEYWLSHHDPVSDAWDGADYQPAILELTAHNLTVNGEVLGSEAGAMAGVTRFRSASMDVSFSEAAANASMDAGWSATRYGQMFAVRLRRNVGGVRLVGCAG